jgi:Ca2+-binding RTX toxin-like protein
MGRTPARGPRRRAPVAAAAAVIALLAFFPAPAGAATLSGNEFSVSYTADAGEANTLTIDRVGSLYRFTDAAGLTITPAGDCAAAGNVGTCPVAQVNNLFASLDDLNDTATAASSLVEPVDVNIFGGEGNDTLSSTAQVETQLSGDNFGDPPGNDILIGGPGVEFLSGGGGNDAMAGNDGDDRFSVDDGDDTMNGGNGDDSFGGGEGPDGIDIMLGGPGSDRIDMRGRLDDLHIDLDGVADDGAGCPGPGCEGDNYGADVESVDTGQGDDTLIGGPRADRLQSEGGTDLIQGLGGGDSLGDFGESGDRLEGGPGEDELFGGGGPDVELGGPGDDRLFYEFFDLETDRYSGGGGFDSISGLEDDMGIRVSLNNAADDGFRSPLFTGGKDNVQSDVEDVEGSDGPDVLTGSARPNQFAGLGGRDRIIGLGGQDGLIGSRGRDYLVGGKGIDLFDGGGGPDVLRSRDGRPDEVRCGSSLDRVKADRSDRFGPDCDKVALGRRGR